MAIQAARHPNNWSSMKPVLGYSAQHTPCADTAYCCRCFICVSALSITVSCLKMA